ncbi:anti-sigma factor [Mucilaginibacter robiniae]|uniref:Anti-sigma factor n=1 Tax=Mucilaginibacter robiniae TaxID=2728022 RepID=A0A7L5E2Q0_9SPHI|nr:anti-sigma factor [Mucilaginibacter robiniae]QJD96707.1 anti-sigma factor [Mucilaginibacter robiniae]
MSKRLEDFIQANREAFDDLEPRPDLWSRIEQQLPAEPEPMPKREAKTFTLGFVLRVAAIIIIVMGIGFTIYLRTQTTKGVDLAAINPEYAKQQVQYASLVQAKRTELRVLAQNDPQLYQEFSHDIAKMDSAYRKLNHDLATSPNQERVLRAMIRNLQIQTEVLNQQLQAIEQFNQFKNQQNETKNI